MRFLPFYFDEDLTFGRLKKFNYTKGINPNQKYVSQNFVDKIHNMQQKVFCWTVNEKENYNRLKKIGVDGIITNFPEKFK